MLDIGFQNVSRLMVSGKPIRVVVLDTQVYSNTGGQACTSGFHGQISDMAAYEGIEPYIDTELCTTCNECTNLNPKMFKYDDNKQAYIADPRAGTFQQLVTAAERCTAMIIHPGTPLDPDEEDLEKWVKRAERFN